MNIAFDCLHIRHFEKKDVALSDFPSSSLEKLCLRQADGRADMGFVTTSMVGTTMLPAGPIRLLHGFQGPRGGFGRLHIEAYPDRLAQLRSEGMVGVVDYVAFVAGDPDAVALERDGRLSVIRRGRRLFHHLICRWDRELSIWSVTTAIPKRNLGKGTILWRKE